MKVWWGNIVHSFPVQLLIIHLKKNPLLIFFWVLLFLMVGNKIGGMVGLHFLFLSPEYLSNVNNLSFFLLGLVLGSFYMTWNTTSYILNAFRFPFLAATKYPYGTYALNNSIVPILFLLYYLVKMGRFQFEQELSSPIEVVFDIVGFLSGIVIWICILALYYFATNKNVHKLIHNKSFEEALNRRWPKRRENWRLESKTLPVEHFLNFSLRWRPVRDVQHYPDVLMRKVFSQNHLNALLGQIFGIAIILFLGSKIENTLFQIPAAASLLLLLSIGLGITGAISYWTRAWRLIAFFVILLGVNYGSKNDIFTYNNKVYGLDYQIPEVEYNTKSLRALLREDSLEKDRQELLKVLENWKNRQSQAKPTLVFVNVSGGGTRSSAWTMQVLQELHRRSEGELLSQTFMMTGASGGMLSAAYFRKLFQDWRWSAGADPTQDLFYENACKDLLNPLMFSLAVNDLVFPFRRFTYEDKKYPKDRGYAFERAFSKNTEGNLEGKLSDLKDLETQAKIPVMVFTPTILNDQRMLMISNFRLRFLMGGADRSALIDAVDFAALFQKHGAQDVPLITALRMGATYPYILPMVHLPSEPKMRVMDAGFRDNFGLLTATRVAKAFSDWIDENCGSVVFIQIRDSERGKEALTGGREDLLGKIGSPISSLYKNLSRLQDYQHDQKLVELKDRLKVPLKVYRLEYRVDVGKEKASLNWRLTQKEKAEIKEAIFFPENLLNFKKLQIELSW